MVMRFTEEVKVDGLSHFMETSGVYGSGFAGELSSMMMFWNGKKFLIGNAGVGLICGRVSARRFSLF
jgi:hypothetical protein